MNPSWSNLKHWTGVRVVPSSDDNVFKLVFASPDAVAEAVLYRYGSFRNRVVICCSTQSGCPVGCRFCGAGEYFVRSLTDDEITEQVDTCMALASHLEGVTGSEDVDRMQVMFMSMGEPALNQRHLCSAIDSLASSYPGAALLISTSAPRVNYDGIIEVSQRHPVVGLQFSVHESTDAARDELIPLKGKLNLQEIADLGDRWAHLTGRTPFFNYCVHPNNNTADDVGRLVSLFDPRWWQATLSVICERDESVAAANDRQRSLAENFEAMMSSAGFRTRTFNPAGQDDIGGGCGQLWFVQDWLRSHPEHAKRTCGTGLPKVHTPQLLRYEQA